MAYCSNCGKPLRPSSNFCNNCGFPVEDFNSETTPNRQEEFFGKIIKCPSCGSEVSSMTAICPVCQHEFNSAKIARVLQDFLYQLNDLDKKIETEPKHKTGWSTWSRAQKILWVLLNIYTLAIPQLLMMAFSNSSEIKKPVLSASEKEKLVLINNFTVPNDRRSILESLRLCQGKIQLIALSAIEYHEAYWASVWQGKAKELSNLASLVLSDDPMVTTILSDIDSKMSQIKKKSKKKPKFLPLLLLIIILIINFIALNETKQNRLKAATPNRISSENVSFSGWLSDNYSFSDQGVYIYFSDENKVIMQFDITCNIQTEAELANILQSHGKKMSDVSLTEGSLKLNSFQTKLSFDRSSSSQSTDIRLFMEELLKMHDGESRTFEIELGSSTPCFDLFTDSSLIIQTEYVFTETRSRSQIKIK